MQKYKLHGSKVLENVLLVKIRGELDVDVDANFVMLNPPFNVNLVSLNDD